MHTRIRQHERKVKEERGNPLTSHIEGTTKRSHKTTDISEGIEGLFKHLQKNSHTNEAFIHFSSVLFIILLLSFKIPFKIPSFKILRSTKIPFVYVVILSKGLALPGNTVGNIAACEDTPSECVRACVRACVGTTSSLMYEQRYATSIGFPAPKSRANPKPSHSWAQ
jgi:hypothetical protein